MVDTPSERDALTKSNTPAMAVCYETASTSFTVKAASKKGKRGEAIEKPEDEPKISADVYHGVSKLVKDSLHSIFAIIASPIEYPSATEYKGPVKIFVTRPIGFGSADKLLTKIGQEKQITVKSKERSAKIINLQVAWPSPASDTTSSDQASANTTKAVDVQLHVFFSREDFTAFRREKILSELWKLLGMIVSKPYGLTLKNDALYFRVGEIERGHNNECHKRIAAIKISDNLKDILDFLGLDLTVGATAESLETWKDLIKYAESCRFYNPAQLKCSLAEVKVDKEGFVVPMSVSQLNANDSQDGALKALTPESLNRRASGQKKAARKVPGKTGLQPETADTNVDGALKPKKFKRTLFNHWSKVYLHSSDAKADPGKDHHFTREQVLEAAKLRFPEFAARFDEDKAEGIRRKSEIKMWRDLRDGTIPKFVKDPTERKYALKGLKNAIRNGKDAFTHKDLKYEATPAWAAMKLSFEAADFDEVVKLAKENWFYAQGAQKWFGEAKSARNYWRLKEEERTKEKAREREQKEKEQQVLLDSPTTRIPSGGLALRKRVSHGTSATATSSPIR